MSRTWPSSPNSSLTFCWDKVSIFQLCVHNLLPNKWGENLNPFFWQGKSKLAKLEFGSWLLKYLILKGSSFWFIIFICINMHSYWLGILRNCFVIYFVALCSSSLSDRGRFDLQMLQNVLAQYFGFYVIMEVTLINNDWSMRHWKNIYIYFYICIVEYPSHILCTTLC